MRNLVAAVALGVAALGAAQAHVPSKVDIAWNRYYEFERVMELMEEIAEAYPNLVELRDIGVSREGRPLRVAIVNAPRTGPHTDKPAMWIDGSVHANEVQATEVVLYTLWYLTKSYGENADLTEIMDRTAFYLMPVVSPDSRVGWFERPTTASFYRGNQRPIDSDRDGLFDEDPPNDLDGDGSITGMWKREPGEGAWVRDEEDPRIFTRVQPGEGDWTYLGQEGLDDDGDGRINEDGPGGDDMNRSWPGGWQPGYVQRGAADYPLQNPETRAIADFILDHPNIGAVQSYHNTGGMLLRGPGARQRESLYSTADVAVYDRLGTIGEDIIPYYNYWVIYEDLYTVHGGFVTWTAETLGIVSFTNELWTPAKYFQRDVGRPSTELTWLWRDRLAFGELFTDYTYYDHPDHGEILVGGPNKWSSRSTPTFMLEEEAHRNFAFTTFHASEMAEPAFARAKTEDLGDGLWSVTFEIENPRAIPTRMPMAADRAIGLPDLLEMSGVEVVAAGPVSSWNAETFSPIDGDPSRVLLDEGIPGRGSVLMRVLVRGSAGSVLRGSYTAEKARDFTFEIELGD